MMKNVLINNDSNHPAVNRNKADTLHRTFITTEVPTLFDSFEN